MPRAFYTRNSRPLGHVSRERLAESRVKKVLCSGRKGMSGEISVRSRKVRLTQAGCVTNDLIAVVIVVTSARTQKVSGQLTW